MIRALQKKIVRVIMLVLFLMVFLGNVLAHAAIIHGCGQITSRILQALAEQSEQFYAGQRIELSRKQDIGTLTISRDELYSIMTTPLYAAELSGEGELLYFGDFRDQTPRDPGEFQETLDTIASRDPGGGKLGGLRYYKAARGSGSFVVLADSSQGFERDVARRLTLIPVIVSIPLLLVLLLVSVLLSRFALSPAVEAFQKQKRFIADAGHELKTPLSTITVNAAVLESELGPNKYMDCIQTEAHRMDGLVRQLLAITCMEDPVPLPQKVRFSLSEAVYQATLPFESLAFERNIRYDADIQEGCQFFGDPERVRQVAAILLDNAFKYTYQGGQVSVLLRREGRRSVIEVYNTGLGISKEDMPHIFERFYRCDKARPGNGSYGLGLAIAKAAVESCGGSISAESEYGQWARFRVTL